MDDMTADERALDALWRDGVRARLLESMGAPAEEVAAVRAGRGGEL